MKIKKNKRNEINNKNMHQLNFWVIIIVLHKGEKI